MDMNSLSTRQKIKSAIGVFARDESGQTTTEYVLLLLFVVLAVKQVGGVLQTRLKAVIEAAFGKVEDEVNR